MNVLPLSDRPGAVRAALLSHGWEGDLARLAAGGLDAGIFHVTGIGPALAEAMLPVAARLGLDLITGDDWLIVAGPRSRLGAFARPWMQPEPVRDLATAIGMALPLDDEQHWHHRLGTLPITGPIIVGAINVTPDSFSDGGRVSDVATALGAAEVLLDGGATLLDVGGESTRPGAAPIAGEAECRRILPVIAALRQQYPDIPLSVDTVHAATASAAIETGASIVNDVTAGRHDPALIDVVAQHGAGVVLSHSRGELGHLASYDNADYGGDVTGGVVAELLAAMQVVIASGVGVDQIVLDPGFGFGKTAEQSLTLLCQLDALVALGRPVLVGASRKRFLGEATGRPVDDRDRATAAACALAYERGARLFRVHDAHAVRDAVLVAAAMVGAPP